MEEKSEDKTNIGYFKNKAIKTANYIKNSTVGKAAGLVLTPVKENILAIKNNFTGEEDAVLSKTLFGQLYLMFRGFLDVILSFLSIPYVSETLFFIFAIIFGFAFYSSNITKNGYTNVSVFTGYCMWAWIFLFLIVIVINRLIKFIKKLRSEDVNP